MSDRSGIHVNPRSALTTIRGSFLRVRFFGREAELSVSRTAGVALVVVGATLLLMMFPSLVTWLPKQMYGTPGG